MKDSFFCNSNILSYYQDIQTRIKSQKFVNNDLTQSEKTNIIIKDGRWQRDVGLGGL